MFKRTPMKISDLTCLLCGSNLGLTLETVAVGDNEGCCPMCNEPYRVNITEAEMKEFIALEGHPH
ncbi:MAG: hypothetical protein JXA20_03505 [Spirochaetes bacterium]|nr:hypothetical protein [Spirochaetota bacterium]